MEHGGQRILDNRRMVEHIAQGHAARQGEHEIMNQAQRFLAAFQWGGDGVDHAEAEVFERGHHIGEDERAVALV